MTAYLNAQIAAGAQAVMVFDTWGGALSDAAYREFSLAYAKKVFAGVTRTAEGRTVPRIFFTKGGGLWLESMAEAGVDALGLDWTIDIGEARRRVGDRVALQGNMDPNALFAPPEAIEREAKRILETLRQGSRARLQPRPRGLPVHAAGPRPRPRRGGPPPLRRGLQGIGRVKRKIFAEVIAYSHLACSRRRIRRFAGPCREAQQNNHLIQWVAAPSSPAR